MLNKTNDMSNKDVNSEKLKALKLTMEKLDKTYGKRFCHEIGRCAG